MNYYQAARDNFQYTVSLRRDFHQHPELGFRETRTAGIVANELIKLGLDVATGIGETGVVGLLKGEKSGPVLLLRFDMDALPIQEETGAEYASVYPRVMHACGHDGHVAIGLSVAKIFAERRDLFSGQIKFVFQPGEEGLGGAERMIAAGVLENPQPDMALAVHLWNEKPVGWYGISAGYIMAAGEIFNLRVRGIGGHGALPHLAVDPVLAAADLVVALQSISSRNISPLDSAVVSVTSMHGGDSFNVIPDKVALSGTIRTFSPEVRQRVLKRFQQVCNGLGEAYECQVDSEIKMLTPAVFNDATITKQVYTTANTSLPNRTIDQQYRVMVSDDMAFILGEIPGTYCFVGSANPAKGLNAGHHHPSFDFEEEALVNAVALVSSAASSLLN
jgi:amidohydrolase